jgi:isoleucyl-tRNA synthetase
MEDSSKTPRAHKEEKTLAYWKEKNIFEKTLEKPAPKGDFVFYEGPPTANAKPALHHLISRVFKDALPRYKTMQGFRVHRKAGWDTHGLPVELQVEKALGFKSKKDIEEYGIAAFNKECKKNVWKNIEDWERFTDRIGYWVDQKNPYITYQSAYMESLWHIMSEVDKKKLLYKDYRIVPWCTRCGTALSSHELAQGYAEVKDPSIYVKFLVVGEPNTYFLVWTTTPWTLPSNLALAVGENVEYVYVKKGEETFILAKKRIDVLGEEYEVIKEVKGKDLLGKSYTPIFDFLKGDANENSFKVYGGDFVNTEDGTGIVHIAPMYGQDDFALATKNNIPKKHLVGADGLFVSETGWLAGKVAKDNENTTNIEIIKHLAEQKVLFKNGSATHTYPFCWRCKTPLLYYARDSWYIAMSKLRNELVDENKKINWEPAHLQEGRFGEWLREVKDWAISRERYWGTPLPVWVSADGDRKVIGSIAELKKYTQSKNTYTVMRHGIAQNNEQNIISGKVGNEHHLTPEGKKQVEKTAHTLRGKKIDFIYASPFLRTRETAELVAQITGVTAERMVYDVRLAEIDTGELNLRPVEEYHKLFKNPIDKFTQRPAGGETLRDIKKRMGDFIYTIEKKHTGKNILIISHEYPLWMLDAVSHGWSDEEAMSEKSAHADYVVTGSAHSFNFTQLPHNEDYDLDLHRPYIDEVELEINGKTYTRVPEVMDVWFDSGAMPFAQNHYPFETENGFNPKKSFFKKQKGYPADYISEAIDQTRGWFYTLLAVGTLLAYGTPYKNVISLGHILDEKGKKMSKSIGNILDPWMLLDKYGADTLRFWMFTINQPGESKNFDEKTVAETQRKTIGLLENVMQFYALYSNGGAPNKLEPTHVLDRWIYALYVKLVREVTDSLDTYKVLEAGRALRDFIGELSQWYVRRSRDRFRGEDEADKREAIQTLGFILLNLSKLTAPLMPFIAEELYKELGGQKESVHLEDWPKRETANEEVIKNMSTARAIVEEALALRNKSNIKVRQPLASITVKESSLAGKKEFLALIEDELNVKNVLFDATQNENIVLDTTITPELRREGELRELMRAIQDLRKAKGLNPGEKASLTIIGNAEIQTLAQENKEVLMRTASLSAVETQDGEFALTLT